MRAAILFLIVSAAALVAAPSNDLFANRSILAGTNITVQDTNLEADTEPGEDIGGWPATVEHSVWYEWTAPTNGVLWLAGSSTVWDFAVLARAYRGLAVNGLTEAPTNPDGSIPVTTGDILIIKVASIHYVWEVGGGTGPFTLNLAFEAAVPFSVNDAFDSRLEISTPTYYFEGSVVGATNDPGEPLPSGTTKTLWWKFVAPEAGSLTLWANAPRFTPVLTLYEGSNLASLVKVPATNNYRYRVQPGREYKLQMAAGSVTSGAFALNAGFSPLARDSFGNSVELEGTNVACAGNFKNATFEPDEPNPGATNTVWASWAAPSTGRARFTRTGAAGAPFVALYTGPRIDMLKPVRTVGMDTGVFDFLAIEGTVYHFQMGGAGDECLLGLQMLPSNESTNDFFATARRSGGQIYFNPGNKEWSPISCATSELGEPAHLGGAPFKSLWWKWTSPLYGSAKFSSDRSLATNVVLAVYRGASVEALTLLGKGTNNVVIGSVGGGEAYYVAAAVSPDVPGDVLIEGGITNQTAAPTVPGNILREPSWEDTGVVNAKYWGMSSGIGGLINEWGGCDGTTWITFGWGQAVWQDIPTVPGRSHSIKFAMRAASNRVGDGAGDGLVRVLWDGQEVGLGVLPASEVNSWHWAEAIAVANNPTSRVAFACAGRNIELDAFSVISMAEPPQIVAQPASASVVDGGTAGFVVGASGSLPLTYVWFHNDLPCLVQSTPSLILDPVSTNHSGTYQVIVTNQFGAATSAPVTLTVQVPLEPVILWQPYGDTVGVGGYFNFSVVAAGSQPLSFQWLKDDAVVAGETNRTLTFESVDYTNAGTYAVRVENNAGIVWSMGAKLTVTDAIEGGGKVYFRNQFTYPTNVESPVFDVDGFTLLNGSNYLAQLYGGASLELLRPVGRPSHFRTGFNAGYVYPQVVTLPTVQPGSTAVLQVRAWDASKGISYEEARALGGRFGKSDLMELAVGGGEMPPTDLIGLRSFSLKAGLPQFAVGEISFVERLPEGVVVWSHRGEPGFRYVIEKSVHGFEWKPYMVITNVTSTANFTDSPSSGSSAVFYRSRILD